MPEAVLSYQTKKKFVSDYCHDRIRKISQSNTFSLCFFFLFILLASISVYRKEKEQTVGIYSDKTRKREAQKHWKYV